MTPTVSVIIPNYNHEQFLRQRIDSVLFQKYQDFELIILDDCSSDKSNSIIEEYRANPKVTAIVYNETNSGSPFKQWKKGIDLAKGVWIWIAESDDYCEPNFLERLVFSVKEIPDCGLIYSQSYDVDEKGSIIYDRIHYTDDFTPNIWQGNWVLGFKEVITKYMIKKNVIPNTSAVVFRNSFDWNNIFNDELVQMRMSGDWYFWIKLMEFGSVAFLSDHLNYFRTHATISRIHDTKEKRRLRLIEESIVRRYLLKKHLIRNAASENRLIKKWFSLFPFPSALFSPQIHQLYFDESKVSILIRFILYKFRIRLLSIFYKR